MNQQEYDRMSQLDFTYVQDQKKQTGRFEGNLNFNSEQVANRITDAFFEWHKADVERIEYLLDWCIDTIERLVEKDPIAIDHAKELLVFVKPVREKRKGNE